MWKCHKKTFSNKKWPSNLKKNILPYKAKVRCYIPYIVADIDVWMMTCNLSSLFDILLASFFTTVSENDLAFLVLCCCYDDIQIWWWNISL